MRSGRSYIIWVPRDGSGKTRKCLISPSFIRILFIMLFLCVCAVPVMETGILTLHTRVSDLEQKKEELLSEIISLQYLKKALARIEEKDVALRGYFGMERYSFLEQITGAGGTPVKDISIADPDHSKESDNHYSRLSASPPTLPEKLRMLNSNYGILNRLLAKKDMTMETIPNIIPVEMDKPRISSGFGWRKSPFTNRREFHAGIDIMGPKNTKIIAPAVGIVSSLGYDQWIGNYLVLQHTEEIKTIYGHLDKISVKEGMSVKRGDKIGLMGNSGLSTNNHLHYAVIKNDRAVNPMEYILDVRNG